MFLVSNLRLMRANACACAHLCLAYCACENKLRAKLREFAQTHIGKNTRKYIQKVEVCSIPGCDWSSCLKSLILPDLWYLTCMPWSLSAMCLDFHWLLHSQKRFLLCCLFPQNKDTNLVCVMGCGLFILDLLCLQYSCKIFFIVFSVINSERKLPLLLPCCVPTFFLFIVPRKLIICSLPAAPSSIAQCHDWRRLCVLGVGNKLGQFSLLLINHSTLWMSWSRRLFCGRSTG